MRAWAYYNENDPKAAAWLRELVRAGLIATGEVDERDIRDVLPGDLAGFTQSHFFAGIGGWSYALRLAGWADDRPAWTGSCPCQRFSSAARGRKVADDMWPAWRELISACRPSRIFSEQVSSARSWLDGVCDDLEAIDYATRACVLPAYCVQKDHARERIYFASYANQEGESGRTVHGEVAGLSRRRGQPQGMVRAYGVSARMAALSGFGNAIVPQVAAEFIAAYMDTFKKEAA